MMRRAGDQITETIQSVTGAVKDVHTATASYSGTLESVAERMATVKTQDEMKAIVNTIMADTQMMLERNSKLEAELDKSSSLMQDCSAIWNRCGKRR